MGWRGWQSLSLNGLTAGTVRNDLSKLECLTRACDAQLAHWWPYTRLPVEGPLRADWRRAPVSGLCLDRGVLGNNLAAFSRVRLQEWPIGGARLSLDYAWIAAYSETTSPLSVA